MESSPVVTGALMSQPAAAIAATLSSVLALLRALPPHREDQARALAKRAEAMEDQVIAYLQEQGLTSCPLDVGKVTLAVTLRAGHRTTGDPAVDAENKQALIAALRRARWQIPTGGGERVWVSTADLVQETFNHSSLSAFVRELPVDATGDPILAPALAEVLQIRRDPEVRVLKA